MLGNACSFYDFAQPGGNDEMFQMQIQGSGVGIDAFEIGFHPFEKGDFLPIFHKRSFANIKVLLFGFNQHQVHVGEHLVHIVTFGHLIGLLPELAFVHVEVRDKVVLLHVPRSERPVEVVCDGYVSVFCNHLCIRKLLILSFVCLFWQR